MSRSCPADDHCTGAEFPGHPAHAPGRLALRPAVGDGASDEQIAAMADALADAYTTHWRTGSGLYRDHVLAMRAVLRILDVAGGLVPVATNALIELSPERDDVISPNLTKAPKDPEDAPEDSPTCDEEHRDGNGLRWLCTQIPNHRGPHRARGQTSEVLDEWDQS